MKSKRRILTAMLMAMTMTTAGNAQAANWTRLSNDYLPNGKYASFRYRVADKTITYSGSKSMLVSFWIVTKERRPKTYYDAWVIDCDTHSSSYLGTDRGVLRGIWQSTDRSFNEIFPGPQQEVWDIEC